MKLIEALDELRLDVEMLNIWLHVSITPDECIDLHPTDEEILECANAALGMLELATGKSPTALDARTINDVRWNTLVNAWYMLEPPITRRNIEHILHAAREIESWLMTLFPGESDEK